MAEKKTQQNISSSTKTVKIIKFTFKNILLI